MGLSFFIGVPESYKQNSLTIQELKNKKIKAYVTCWTKFPSENYALWKIYDSIYLLSLQTGIERALLRAMVLELVQEHALYTTIFLTFSQKASLAFSSVNCDLSLSPSE
jgi:hypothetical protein